MIELQKHIPEIKINNKKVTKEVEIEGELQTVQVPPKEGFLISTVDDEGKFAGDVFFTKDFSGVILFDKYFVKSKFGTKEFYISNEFTFDNGSEIIVRAPKEKKVLYQGDYSGLRDAFGTGEMNTFGKQVTTYDMFVVLYVYSAGMIFKYVEKLGKSCDWFNYKENNSLGRTTVFKTKQKVVAGNVFWDVIFEVGEEVDEDESEEVKEDVLEQLAKRFSPKAKKEEKKTMDYGVENDEVDVSNIPF